MKVVEVLYARGLLNVYLCALVRLHGDGSGSLLRGLGIPPLPH